MCPRLLGVKGVCLDYANVGLNLRRHPLQMLRSKLAAQARKTAAELHASPSRGDLRRLSDSRSS
jgi:hypothetical protein